VKSWIAFLMLTCVARIPSVIAETDKTFESAFSSWRGLTV
jgi:hypothetical protein